MLHVASHCGTQGGDSKVRLLKSYIYISQTILSLNPDLEIDALFH